MRAPAFRPTPCWVGHGWLPTGYYDLRGHWNNYNGTIRGRVFYLQDKTCWNGTWRTQLFIHSEETADQGQYCPTAGDDPYCWDGPSDYYSNGCIKLSHSGYGFPDNIQDAHWWWHNRDGYSFHGYSTANDALYVYS